MAPPARAIWKAQPSVSASACVAQKAHSAAKAVRASAGDRVESWPVCGKKLVALTRVPSRRARKIRDGGGAAHRKDHVLIGAAADGDGVQGPGGPPFDGELAVQPGGRAQPQRPGDRRWDVAVDAGQRDQLEQLGQQVRGHGRAGGRRSSLGGCRGSGLGSAVQGLGLGRRRREQRQRQKDAQDHAAGIHVSTNLCWDARPCRLFADIWQITAQFRRQGVGDVTVLTRGAALAPRG